MRNHRNAFFLALSLGLVLAGFAAGVWWNELYNDSQQLSVGWQ